MLVRMKAFIQPNGRPKDEVSIEAEYNPDVPSLEAEIFAFAAEAAKDGIIQLLLSRYKLDRIVYSLWEPDTDIYNPSNSRTFNFNDIGLVDAGLEDVTDEDEALFIRRSVTVGRSGKMFFPGALLKSALDETDGQWTLAPAALAAIGPRVLNLFAGLNTEMQMVMIGKSQTSITYPATPEGVKQVPIRNYAAEPHIRLVNSFVVAGVRPRDRDV